MATVQDILAEESYRGTPQLGGTSSGVINIDTKPVEELARYTMFANKADYDQRQKDIDAKVAELANFTALDLNGTRAKDKDYLLGKWDEAQKLSADYARYIPKDQNDKVQKLLEYKEKINQLKNDVNSGTTRAISYQKRLNDINADTTSDAATKAARLKSLDKEFDSTPITTPISAEDKYSVIIPPMPKGTKTEFDVMERQPNGITITSNDVFDAGKAGVTAFSFLNNLDTTPLPPNASEREKTEYNQRQEAFKKNGSLLYQQGADALTAALNDPKYKNADGSIDYNSIKANNKLAAGNLALIDAWNNYAQTMTDKIDKGVFTDKSGRPISNMLDRNNYLQIDKTKPIPAEQLIKAQMWANFEGDKNTKKYVETDDAIQRAKLGIENAKLALDNDEFKLKEKQWDTSQKGGETVKNGAMEFAKNIYSQLANIADNSGYINPEKVRQLNNEQLKYLGVAKPAEEGSGTVLNPLVIPKGAAIVLRGNQIKVLTGAKPTKEGAEGLYDNNLSTTVTNIATNRLNEQLKNAGAKELNSYLPIDLQDGTTVSENTTIKETGRGGGSVTATTMTRTGKDGKVYSSTDGITWTAPDGTTVTLKSKQK